jgi:hypothetical protein
LKVSGNKTKGSLEASERDVFGSIKMGFSDGSVWRFITSLGFPDIRTRFLPFAYKKLFSDSNCQQLQSNLVKV